MIDFLFIVTVLIVHVWKVARYTCSSPLYFGEYDNFVDTSVVCKNLCGVGMEKINSYYNSLQQPTPDPISMVVSLGDGILPAQQLGIADSTATYYLSLSGQARLNNPKELLRAFQNIVALYSSAAVSDLVYVVTGMTELANFVFLTLPHPRPTEIHCNNNIFFFFLSELSE